MWSEHCPSMFHGARRTTHHSIPPPCDRCATNPVPMKSLSCTHPPVKVASKPPHALMNLWTVVSTLNRTIRCWLFTNDTMYLFCGLMLYSNIDLISPLLVLFFFVSVRPLCAHPPSMPVLQSTGLPVCHTSGVSFLHTVPVLLPVWLPAHHAGAPAEHGGLLRRPGTPLLLLLGL